MKRTFLIAVFLSALPAAAGPPTVTWDEIRQGTRSLDKDPIIHEIRISGNYPYLSRRLRRTIAIHPGDLFSKEDAERQLGRLEAFYEREGYFGSAAELEVFRSPRWPSAVDLQYRIRRGEQYRLGQIDISGYTAFPRGRFVSALNPLLPYKPGRLRWALEKIEKGYRDRGYLEARVRVVSVTPDHVLKKVSLVLEVREGPLVTIRFRGNSRLRLTTLKREIPLIQEGDASLYGIHASVEALRTLYQRHGFQEARVEVDREKPGPNRMTITFHIQEGVQTRVKRIEIAGNERIGDRKIKKTFRTREQAIFRNGFFEPELLGEDVDRLPDQYRRWGFPEISVSEPQAEPSPLKDKISIRLPVQEGAPNVVEEIRFAGNELFPDSRLRRRLKMKPGDFLDQDLLENDRKSLLAFYSDRGRPYAELQAEYRLEGGKQVLVYRLEEGPEVLVGEILILGNYRTRQRSIARMLDLKSGRSFSYRKLLKSESSLRKTGVFRSVEIEPIGLQERHPAVPLLLRLEENPVAVIDLDSSFDTDDRFTGSFTLHQNNLFGFAKRGNIRFTGGLDIQKVEANYVDPRFAGLDFELVGGGLFAAEQRPGFSAIDAGGKVSLLREFTPEVSLLTKYELTRTYFRDVTDPTDLTQRDNTTSAVGLSVNYDTRDSFADPRNGFTLLSGLDISIKLIASGSDFIKPFGAIAHFQSFGGRVTLLNYLRLEGIQLFGGDVLTRDKRLFLGGDYTVRGFGQDALGPQDASGAPTGGLVLLLHTAELQTRLKGEFKFALFADTGTLTNSFDQIGLTSLRHSAGAGLRYVTPIGPLRLDYGVKLDRQPGEAASRLHFAFGYAF